MKSPFPGMDPYIESSGLWENFHFLLIAQIHQQLAPSLRIVISFARPNDPITFCWDRMRKPIGPLSRM